MRSLLVALCLSALVGCAGTESTIQSDLGKVQTFAVTDIQAALDDATAKQDTAAVNCYATLLQVVKGATISAPQIKGVVSAFQAGRDVLSNSGATSVGKQINIGCAALFVDAAFTVGKIAAMAGVGVPGVPLPLP